MGIDAHNAMQRTTPQPAVPAVSQPLIANVGQQTTNPFFTNRR